MSKLRLIINNKLNQKENFFVRKELQTILNLYAQKVSCGDWKDYGLSINKKEISFDIYHRTSEVPIFKISKNLNPKNKIEKFYVLDKNSNVIKQSENLENLINKTKWEKLRLVK